MADDIFSGDLRTDGVEVRDSAIWHFRDGKITEIFTLQDQFGFLKQIGYFPESVSPA